MVGGYSPFWSSSTIVKLQDLHLRWSLSSVIATNVRGFSHLGQLFFTRFLWNCPGSPRTSVIFSCLHVPLKHQPKLPADGPAFFLWKLLDLFVHLSRNENAFPTCCIHLIYLRCPRMSRIIYEDIQDCKKNPAEAGLISRSKNWNYRLLQRRGSLPW